MPPFFTPGPASDEAYAFNRDHPSRAELRARIEYLWERFSPYCGDAHFLTDARAHFHQRTWEMYLACVLLERGYTLKRTGSNTPDIRVSSSPTTWIEAVAPTPGTGDDAAERKVKSRQNTEHGERIRYGIDRDKTILRYTSALDSKASLTRHKRATTPPKAQYVAFVDRGSLREHEAFMVAMNAGKIDDADIEDELPDIVRALFPIGEAVVRMPIESDQPHRVEHPFRDVILKSGGADVRTDPFLDPQYACVSAVLFSPYGIWNANDLSGREMILVHNPRARVPLENGRFQFGREYWLVEHDDVRGAIEWHNWNTGRGALAEGG